MVKKIPLIGLIIGAIAAAFALIKHKKDEPADADNPPASPPPSM